MGWLARIIELPMDERVRTVEAALCLFTIRLLFAALPFACALRALRIVAGQAAASDATARVEAVRVARAIRRAARHVPFRAACLQQAFAAVLMLRHRGVPATVRLGLAREASLATLRAHAWSCCGETPVTGVELAQDFVPIASFTTIASFAI